MAKKRRNAKAPQNGSKAKNLANSVPPKLELEKGSSFAWGDENFASWVWDNQKLVVFDQDEFISLDYEEMLRRDGKARAIEQVLTLPIKSATWSIEPGHGDSGEADFVRDALTRPANMGGMQTPMRLVIAQALSARTHKKACFEKVFQEVDGKITYKKLAFRPSSTTGILRDKKSAKFAGFQQRPVPINGTFPTGTKDIWINVPPMYCWVHINNQHVNSSYGNSDLEQIFWLHNQKNKILYLWATFLEVQAAGRYVVIGPDETTTQKYAKAIRSMKNGGVVGISGPEGERPSVDTLETGTGAAALFKQFLDYCDQQMAESVLAGFLNLTGTAGHGSFALSKDQSDFFLQSLTACANELAESITNYVIADLVRLNFGTGGVCPTFKFGPITENDLDVIKDILVAFATAQVPPRVPQEFISKLTLMLAGYLDMPVEELEKQFEEVEQREKEKADLDLEGKKAGLKMQAMALQNGGNNPIAGATARKTNNEMLSAGQKIGAATNMVQKKKAADASAKKTTTTKPATPKPKPKSA